MTEKPIRHRYPIWLAWPLEVAALLLTLFATWTYLRGILRVVFQQWPALLENLSRFPQCRDVLLYLVGQIPNPVPWEELYGPLIDLHVQAAFLFFVAALLSNFLPRLRIHESGLQVQRGLGWATIPWDRITLVNSMALPGDRLVLLIQGRRWPLGPWFRLYSLLWGAGLRKGVVVVWHISGFDLLANTLVARLTEIYGERDLALVVDDTAYSLFYALLFLPRDTWTGLFAPRATHADGYAYSKWVHTATRSLAGVLLAAAAWRYLGVWWRYLAGRIPDLTDALRWPIAGLLLRTFGQVQPFTAAPKAVLSIPEIGLLLGQVNMVLVLAAMVVILNLFPDWLLGAEGVSVFVRRRWLQIPWRSIVALRETIYSNGRGIALLQVKRSCLTAWHVVYSFLYGAPPRRGVLFASLLPGFQELRERIHVGVMRAREADPQPLERPVLGEHTEAEFLLMIREPRTTLRRWGEGGEEETPGRLFKEPGGYVPAPSTDLPWETVGGSDWLSIERTEEKEKRVDVRPAAHAVIILAVSALVLVLFEEILFPPLSRPLALFALPIGRLDNPLLLLLLAVLMGLLVAVEWPFVALLMAMIAEAYDQSADYRQALSLHPRIQSPRAFLAVLLLVAGTTGLIQPLFLLWWAVGALWGAVLLWLTGYELYRWRGAGNYLLIGGYLLYQGLVLLAYLITH